MRYEKMADIEKQAYERFVENRCIEMSVTETAREEGYESGVKDTIVETAKSMKQEGLST